MIRAINGILKIKSKKERFEATIKKPPKAMAVSIKLKPM